ncbi:MAG: hypothetical protein GY832_01925 [Chloroflexi bacterium]|nr:hypothetical protein [Chloroflexota bacterium]
MYIVEITADQGWQDTDVYLEPGQQVWIEYMSGQITDADTTVFDGDGSDYVCGRSECCEPMPDAPRSSLVGRVGRIESEVFLIGNGGAFEADATGLLLLRINDCDAGLYDNSGSFRVRIVPEGRAGD